MTKKWVYLFDEMDEALSYVGGDWEAVRGLLGGKIDLRLGYTGEFFDRALDVHGAIGAGHPGDGQFHRGYRNLVSRLLDAVDNGRQSGNGGIVPYHYFLGANIDHRPVDAVNFLGVALDDGVAVSAHHGHHVRGNQFAGGGGRLLGIAGVVPGGGDDLHAEQAAGESAEGEFRARARQRLRSFAS